MSLSLAFILFLTAMITSIILDFSMIPALLAGLLCFGSVGIKKGFSLSQICKMCISGLKSSIIVIQVMCIIGFVTAVWRVSGTITLFVYYGIKIITPSLFLLVAFILSCFLSYALGTSFGVAGTVGVIFMALARSGGVNTVITAGVLMSGIYFGDRGSPVSSSANMVAGVTGTDIYGNVRRMMKSAIIPFLITMCVYTFLSFSNPINSVNPELVASFEKEFVLSPWSLLPAAFMLILPLLKVKILFSMGTSVISGILVSWLVQKTPLLEVFKICVFGYKADGTGLSSILNGGGLVSMLEIIIILMISSSYSGIFNGTDMLNDMQKKISSACSRFGRFTIMVAMSLVSSMIFCNQTIATLICADLMRKPYLDGGGSKEELAIDIENSVILIACMIPWCIGCSVPLSFFGETFRSIPYAIYMYAIPITYFFTKKLRYKSEYTCYLERSENQSNEKEIKK